MHKKQPRKCKDFYFLHSAKQNEIQEQYYAVEAKKGELQRIIDDEGEKITYVFKIFLRSNGAMQAMCS